MVSNLSKLDEVNVLASGANWAWPEALRNIFQPRDVNLLVAERSDEFVNNHRAKANSYHDKVDMDSESGGTGDIKKLSEYIIRCCPAILLASVAGGTMLSRALELDVFGVIDKPVDNGVFFGSS